MDVPTFLLSFLLWELLDLVLRRVIRAASQRRCFRDIARDARTRAILVTQGPAYVKSTLHALVVGARGWRHLYIMWHAPPQIKLRVTEGGAFYPESLAVMRTNCALGGYLASDLLHVLLMYPNLGALDTVAHHVAFLLCAWVAGAFRAVPFMFGWLIVGECSTPFLNLRWLLIKAKRTQGALFVFVQYAFCTTFVFLRMFVYSAGMFHHFLLIRGTADVQVHPAAMHLIAAFVLLGFALNLVWTAKIFAAVRRGGAKTSTVHVQPPRPCDVKTPLADCKDD